MNKIKKLINKCRKWLIVKLGGITEDGVKSLIDSCYSAHYNILIKWRKAMQEVCRRSDNSYYDWCCEHCQAKDCKRHTGWCEEFYPK